MANKPQSSSTRLLLAEGKPSVPSPAEALAAKGDATSDHALTTLRFGSVTVEAKAPTSAEIRRNIVSGQLALARALPRLLKPGVVLNQHHGVPLYHADPNVPGRIVRELNGKSQSGTFLNGKFRPSK